MKDTLVEFEGIEDLAMQAAHHILSTARSWAFFVLTAGAAPFAHAQAIEPAAASVSITELCETKPNLRTLVVALEQSGLALYLADNGPVTLLAPTDQAFAKLDDEFLDELFDPDNVQALRAVLAYHVLPRALPSEELARTPTVRTIGTQHLFIEARPGGLIVDANARLLDLDLAASNGVVHTVDTVLLPATRTIEEILDDNDQFSIIHRLLNQADRDDLIGDPGRRMTFLAPTNDAIRAISPRLPDVLDRGVNRTMLRELLESLMIEGGLSIDEALARQSVESVSGRPLSFESTSNGLRVNGMRIGATNIDALNGAVHVLESFSIPSDLRPRVRGDLMIGVQTRDLSRSDAKNLGATGSRAFRITHVSKGGGAARAGLRVGDIVLSVDGYPATISNLTIAKRERGFGGFVELTIYRGNRVMQLSVPVGLDD